MNLKNNGTARPLLIINFPPADLTFLINHKRTSRGDNGFLKLTWKKRGNLRPIILSIFRRILLNASFIFCERVEDLKCTWPRYTSVKPAAYKGCCLPYTTLHSRPHLILFQDTKPYPTLSPPIRHYSRQTYTVWWLGILQYLYVPCMKSPLNFP